MTGESSRQQACRPSQGFAYILAISVVLAVSAVAIVMASAIGLRLQSNNGITARLQCQVAAYGLLRAVINDLSNSQSRTGIPELMNIDPAGEHIGDCLVILLGRDPDCSGFAYGLISESSRIDINSKRGINQLRGIANTSLQMELAITDWIDRDSELERTWLGNVVYTGAERGSACYVSNPIPYEPRNGPIQTIDELRMINGVTDECWFGEDRCRNGILDPGEDANGDGLLNLGLRDLITIMNTRAPARAPDGSPLTDIAKNQDLASRLIDLFGQSRGSELAEKAHKAEPSISRLLLIKSLDLTDAEASRLWPYLDHQDPGTGGAIDIWSAPREVLVSAFGVWYARDLIRARPSTRPNGPNWIARAMDSDFCARYDRTIACVSYQFRADIVAIRRDGAGWSRTEALIDCSDSTPRIVSIRPTENDGWPFPCDTPSTANRYSSVREMMTSPSTGRP